MGTQLLRSLHRQREAFTVVMAWKRSGLAVLSLPNAPYDVVTTNHDISFVATP